MPSTLSNVLFSSSIEKNTQKLFIFGLILFKSIWISSSSPSNYYYYMSLLDSNLSIYFTCCPYFTSLEFLFLYILMYILIFFLKKNNAY